MMIFLYGYFRPELSVASSITFMMFQKLPTQYDLSQTIVPASELDEDSL